MAHSERNGYAAVRNEAAAQGFAAAMKTGLNAAAGGFFAATAAGITGLDGVLAGRPQTSAAALAAGLCASGAWGVVIGLEPPAEPAYARFTMHNMSGLNVSASSDICTALVIRYGYDWSGGEYKKAILLEAPEQIERYGRISRAIEAKWLRSPRQAYLLGERMLSYWSRPRWVISFSAAAREARSIPPGVWVEVEHPHAPVSGRMLVINSELDPSAAQAELTVEALAGDPPRIALARLSEAYAPQLPDGVAVSYAAGHAVFTISDEEGRPIPGAKVTLDGGLTLPTDAFGRVSFQTARGAHHLKIEAAGYVTQELEVTV